MFISYTYKLAPSKAQTALMETYLELLRLQFNFRIRERSEAYEQVRVPKLGNYCDLKTQTECCPLACSVSPYALYGDPWGRNKKTGQSVRRSAYHQQSSDLANLRRDRPWYQQIHRCVLVEMLRQVDRAFQNFFTDQKKPLKQRRGVGYPRLKRKGRMRAFTYPPNKVQFNGNAVRLPGVGWMKFFQSRLFPEGFAPRSVTVKRQADGFYLSIRLKGNASTAIAALPTNGTAIGVDMGIRKLMALSTGETISNPQFDKQQERRRRIRRRRATRKVKGSHKRAKAYRQVAKLEQKVACQRDAYQWKAAHRVVDQAELIVLEDLNIQGMMARCRPKQDEQGHYLPNRQSTKAKLHRAIADAAWYEQQQKIKVLAQRQSKPVLAVNPKRSSQECSECSYVSPTNRSVEKFLCESCGHLADADIDAAKVILKRGLNRLHSQ